MLGFLLHEMHVHKERVEPEMEHDTPLVIKHYLDVPTEGHWLG